MTTPLLLPQHQRLIESSGISVAVAGARRYRSIEIPGELRELGFLDHQCQVPALLVPLWSTGGGIGGYQARPDMPRRDERSREVKYETPSGQRNLIDVHPTILDRLGNPTVPLYITEGVRKADSAVSRGLVCIALSGVWNWIGRNQDGGKTALPDWREPS